MFGRERAEMSEITIVNALAVVVYKQNVGNKVSSLKVNVSQWPAGMYMVKLGGTGIARQLIVQ